MTILSYVGDLSNIQPDTRIRRFTNAEACEGVGTIAGFYAGSLIVQYAFGDFYIFIICASSCLVAFIYGILRIENIIPEKEIDGDNVVEVILRVIIYILILDILYRKLQNCCGTTVALTMWNHFPNLLENVEPFSLKYRDWFQFVEPFSQFILNSMENQVEPIWFHILSISCSIAILWNQYGSTLWLYNVVSPECGTKMVPQFSQPRK